MSRLTSDDRILAVLDSTVTKLRTSVGNEIDAHTTSFLASKKDAVLRMQGMANKFRKSQNQVPRICQGRREPAARAKIP